MPFPQGTIVVYLPCEVLSDDPSTCKRGVFVKRTSALKSSSLQWLSVLLQVTSSCSGSEQHHLNALPPIGALLRPRCCSAVTANGQAFICLPLILIKISFV